MVAQTPVFKEHGVAMTLPDRARGYGGAYRWGMGLALPAVPI